MTKTKSTSPRVYASILSQIKTSLEGKHEDNLNTLTDVVRMMEENHINVEEMCRYSDKKAYYHNKYMMSVFYLTLGECYDSEICPTTADHDLALKYYSLSNQPPAKWRIARLYSTGRLPLTPKVSVEKLIVDAITVLIQDDDYNQRFFGKRFEYLLDMYTDLYELHGSVDIYFDILKWIIENRQNINGEHQDILCQFLEFEVPCKTNSDDMTLEECRNLLLS